MQQPAINDNDNISPSNTDSFPYVYGMNVEKLYPDVTVNIERITPEIAEKMLVANIGNRDFKREPIAKAIEIGEWTLNGATIVFDDNGVLVDGQNRLIACVKTGIAIDTIVVRGIKRDAQITMDTGIKRQLADYLKIAGYKNCTTVGSIGTKMYRMDTLGIEACFNKQGSDQATIKMIFDFINNNYESRIEPLIRPVYAVRGIYKGVESGVFGALFDVFRGAGEENLNEFINQLTNRSVPCSSVRLLQGRLRANAENKQMKINQKTLAALIIKAWNAYMRGEEMAFLRFIQGGAHPESFPEVFIGYD